MVTEVYIQMLVKIPVAVPTRVNLYYLKQLPLIKEMSGKDSICLVIAEKT